ncbi:preprotein translocase subunit SecE [Burkholderia cepacia]|uniref:preprotein translocase subunit SecE n=1 Tax=Burkholderia cepacia TaxID=292 RepID=UPI0018678587|nr:preprotein translocase subunit SecE [Burkholderia cepacia]
MSTSSVFSKISNYFVKSYEELKKVNWPKRENVIRLTVIVIVSTLIAMLLVSGLDWVLTKIIDMAIS